MSSEALVAGIVAGLAIAVPLGAIGVLILGEGLAHGSRAAAAAALGVAVVDLTYAGLATTAGAALTAVVHDRIRLIQLVGAAVLVAVAVRGLLGLRRTRPLVLDPTTGRDTWLDTGRETGLPPGPASPRRTPPEAHVLLRFIGLTAINPLTGIYFVVLAAGLGQTVAGRAAGSSFVAGVFVGSLAWQLVLAVIGSLAGARLPGWARMATGVGGHLLVLGYAVRLALGA